MKPIVKYQGGKTKELPLIKKLLPDNFKAVIEPFAGGAAVSFALEKPALLNDISGPLINMYKAIQKEEYMCEIWDVIEWLRKQEHDELEKQYYFARDVINAGDDHELIRAYCYIILRQLCFSGMERYNAKGEFNVPFGHYKRFSCNLTWDHHLLMQDWQIHQGDFHYLFNLAEEDDFIFIDPPYLDRLGYTEGDGGTDLHERLVESMKSTSAKWLFVHSDCDFYREKLADYRIMTREFGYSQRFGKGKDHSGAAVKHLYITNYDHDVDRPACLPNL